MDGEMDFLMTLIDENHWSDLDNNITMNTIDNKANNYIDKDTDKESSISTLSMIKTKKDTKQIREERLLKLSAKKQMNSLNNHNNSLEPMDIQSFDNTSLIDDNYIDLFNDDIEDVDINYNSISNTINNKKRRRKSSENPDAAIIALATDKHLKAMNIDPNSKEGKFQIRRIRNRMSAQLHRERKKELIDTLQETIKSKDTSIYLLNLELDKIKHENELLKERLGIPIHVTDNSSIHSTSNSLTSVSNISSITIPSNLSDNRIDNDSNHYQSNDAINPQKFHETEVSNYEYRSLILLIILTFLYFCYRSTNISSFSQSLFYNPIDTTTSTNQFWNVYDSTSSKSNDENNDNNHRKLLTLPYTNNQAVYISTALTTSNDNLHDESDNHLTKALSPVKYIDMNENSKQSKSLINSNHAMWKYQNKELTIFPHIVVNKLTNKKKQNLRSRNHSRFSSTIELNDLNEYDDSYMLLSDNEKAIIASNYMNSYMNKYLSDDSITSLSRILLTQGKTLLDPSLVYNVISPLANPVTTNPVTTSASSVDSNIISSRITNVVKPVESEKAVSTWLLKSENTINNKPFIIQTNDDSKSNVLVMLLPASSVRWGKSWSDSTENSMDWMLRSLNYTSAYDNTTYNQEKSENINDFENMWVEIGCSIFKAQIVSNVSFPS